MKKYIVNEREFELINIIGSNLDINQRELSSRLSLSLGMTNVLIRRMVAKGYIRISQLNHRKVKYLLTPKGFAEKVNKTIKYTLKTIHSMNLIKDVLKGIIDRYYKAGQRDFWMIGQADIVALIVMILREDDFKEAKFHLINEAPKDISGVLLICVEEDIQVPVGITAVHVMHELAQAEQLHDIKQK